MSVHRFVHVEKMEDPVGSCLYFCCWSMTIKKLVVCSFFYEFGNWWVRVESCIFEIQEIGSSALRFDTLALYTRSPALLLARSLLLPMCRQTDKVDTGSITSCVFFRQKGQDERQSSFHAQRALAPLHPLPSALRSRIQIGWRQQRSKNRSAQHGCRSEHCSSKSRNRRGWYL